MNAALGFDTYLVMRHGVRETTAATMETDELANQSVSYNVPGSQLGCYFCNDVVAPGNVSHSVKWSDHFQGSCFKRSLLRVSSGKAHASGDHFLGDFF